MTENNIEKIIQEAVELREKGKLIPEILSLFPKHIKVLEEIFGIIEILSSEKERIKPPKELLMKIISRIPSSENVTEIEVNRSLDKRESKGRPSFFRFERFARLNFMRKQAILLAGLLVVALVILAGIYLQPPETSVSQGPSTGGQEPGTEEGNKDVSGTSPAPTGAVVDVSSLVNVETELDGELEGITTDVSDMEAFESDTSLNNLDESLGGF